MNYDIAQTEEFEKWHSGLKDREAAIRIATRITRIQQGNFGDHHAVGKGVSELRLTYGPGYRVYYTIKDNVVVILLCGGDKSTQDADIKRAQAMAEDI
jgi:putative addiction module killer protein